MENSQDPDRSQLASADLPTRPPCTVQRAMQSISSLQMQLNDGGFSTPVKKASIPLSCSSFTPKCEENLKPKLGMTFEGLDAVEKFYKDYAHESGFGVCVGQQKKLDNEIVRTKRYMCNREGFKSEKGKEIDDPSKKRRKNTATRYGCDAHIFVKLCGNDTYKIESWVEHHNHGLVSPDKRHMIRSNRRVSERAKNELYTCHKASIGTCQAYRLLQVREGGIDKVGCMKRDFQNYYRDLRYKIRNADAQMFVAQLARKQEVNSAFFYDFEVSDEGNLMYVFWADATSRKNYKHFGNVVSFDSTYTTNQYDMIFAPFTGVNHHLQSVFFGAVFLLNEQKESYVWLFKTFLRAMGGEVPGLIITDEARSMKNAIDIVFLGIVHRLCMWHIMDKLPEKVGPVIREEPEFWKRMNACVWGSETPTEFELEWNSVILDFGLEDNEWFTKRFSLRESWIPAYFMDISLAGILRTTSRSESANSFFNRFIHTHGIPCRHIIQVMRIENQQELPTFYIMERWKKRCKRESVYDLQGNLLEEKPTDSLDAAARKKISTVRNKLEDLIQTAKQSDEGMDFLLSSVLSIEEPLRQKVPTAVKHTRQEEYEAFIGCNIPTQINIHPPNDVRSVGRSKRIKRGKEMNGEEQKKKKKEAKAKVTRLCKTCNQVGFHDSRNCPSKNVQGKEAMNVQDMNTDGAS